MEPRVSCPAGLHGRAATVLDAGLAGLGCGMPKLWLCSAIGHTVGCQQRPYTWPIQLVQHGFLRKAIAPARFRMDAYHLAWIQPGSAVCRLYRPAAMLAG
jgi:hypothetical protein